MKNQSPPPVSRTERRGPRPRTHLQGVSGSLLVLGLVLGCSAAGDKGMASGGSGPGTGGTAGTGGGGALPVPVATTCDAHLPQRVVLLSDYQASNATRGLLGDAALKDTAPTAEEKPFTLKGFVISSAFFSTRLGWAEFAATSLDARFTEVTGCAETADDACVQQFLERFAKSAFRRPVKPEEIADLMLVYAAGKPVDAKTGVKLAVEAILAAPSFSLRTEFGTPDASGRAVLTPHEVASELSFLLTDSVPDAELMAAADSGSLATPEGLTLQVQRLLESPLVQASLGKTLLSAWDIDAVFGASKDPTLFPEYTVALQASMYRETELFVKDKLWGTGPLSDLLTSQSTFGNATIAALYGVPHTGATPSDFVQLTLPANTRAGLFTQPSMLSMRAGADVTSVVGRGLFVRGALLCLPKTPSPPASVQAKVEEQVNASGTRTQKELANERATTQPCGGCHAQFDPMGLMLENYDPIGRYRSDIGGVPVDNTAVFGDAVGAFVGTYMGIAEFAQVAATSPEFKNCLSRQLLAYGLGDEELTTDSCAVSETTSKLPATNTTFRDVVREVALAPGLWVRKVEAAQ